MLNSVDRRQTWLVAEVVLTVAAFAPGSMQGRFAVVTCAGSGIGRAIALTFGALGATVAVLDRDGDAVTEVVTDLTRSGAGARPVAFDLGRTDGIESLVEQLTADHGPCTVLVNNAGIVGAPLLETTLSDWNRVLAVNATAPFLLIREFGRLMIGAGGRSIVNVSSSSAFRAMMSGGAYAASKAALGALTRAAAWELGPANINVNTVAPGVTRTPITAAAFGDAEALDAAVRSGPLANLLQRVSEPEDVANVVAFLCLPASRQITGQVIHTSAGAIVPA